MSVATPNGLTVAELMGVPRLTLADTGGEYRVRISARGRDAGQSRGDTGRNAALVEHFLIEAWLAPMTDGANIRSTSLKPVDHSARDYLAAARTAAERINADLDESPGSRPLSGKTGTVEAEWTYRATRRNLFRPFAFLWWWTSAMSSGGQDAVPGAEYFLSCNDYRDIFDGLPTGNRGHVHATLLAVDSPAEITTAWHWKQSRSAGQGPSLFETTLITRLTQTRNEHGKPETTVRITHTGLPVEWLSDMHDAWLCKLEAGAKVYRLEE